MAAIMVNLSAICAQLEQSIVDNLHKEYPYMNLDAIRDMAKASAELVKTRTAEQ